MTPSSGSLVNMTDQQVAALTGGIAPARIAHKVDPNDVLAGKPSFIPYDGSDPQPGDALQFDTSQGRYQFVIADDGSWQLAGAPKAPSRAAPSGNDVPTSKDLGGDPTSAEGKLVDYYAGKLNDPTVSAAEKATLFTAYNSATEKLAATKPDKPTQGPPEMHNFGKAGGGWQLGVKDLKTGNWTPVKANPAAAEGGLDWVKQQLASGNGTQGFGSGSQWNDHELGQDINTPFGTEVPLVNGVVTAVEDWGYGDHAIVIQRPDGSEVTFGHIQNPTYQVGDAVSPQSVVLSGGKASPISSGPQVEVRVKQNGQYIDPAQYVQGLTGTGGPSGSVVNKQHVNIGGKEYVFDPATGQLTDTGLGSNELVQLQIQKAKQDLLSKSQLALSQQYDTLNYLHQALLARAISPSDASAYYGLVKQQTAAQLAGTTAFGIYKQQQDFEAQQATNAKALLDTQVTASDSLVKTLLNELAPSSKVPPLVASSVPFDVNSVLGAAQGNIQRYIPAGLTQSAQQLLGQFYGPQPAAPGSVDANGRPVSNMPLSPEELAALGIGGGQGAQPAPTSAGQLQSGTDMPVAWNGQPPDQNTPSDQIVNMKAA